VPERAQGGGKRGADIAEAARLDERRALGGDEKDAHYLHIQKKDPGRGAGV
jgi:hypothetical protein